ncbi:outer membrane beta-barrel protein [Hymenobacter humi]|uniref:Outer membrane beta-barrel protein n=1 Tax=Hymenobacter humi TaxID=1411620 RepID=A0ABW2U3D5_9BACT
MGLPNQPLALLKHGLVQVMRNNQPTTVVETGYRNTLRAVLTNCPVVEKKLATLSFQESTLINLVGTYNRECAGYVPIKPLSTATKSHLVFGLMAGVAQQTLKYDGFPYPKGGSARETHVGIALGPTLRYTSGRLGQRLSFGAALLYEPEKFEIGGTGISNNGFPAPAFRHAFDLAYLRLPLTVRYKFIRGKVMPFAEAGLTVAYAIKETTRAEQYDSYAKAFKPSATTVEGTTGRSFRALETGVGAGVGAGTMVNGRFMSLLLRAEAANGFSKSPSITTTVLHLYGLLSFDLTK